MTAMSPSGAGMNVSSALGAVRVVGVTNRHPRFRDERCATMLDARSLADHEAQNADVDGLANVKAQLVAAALPPLPIA